VPSGDAILRVPTSASINTITTSGNPTYTPLSIQLDASQSSDALTVAKVGAGDPLLRVTQSGGLIVGPYSALDGSVIDSRGAFTASSGAVAVQGGGRNSAVGTNGLFRAAVTNGGELAFAARLDDSPTPNNAVFQIQDSGGNNVARIEADGTFQSGRDVFTTGQAIVTPGTDARLTASRVANGSSNMLLLESDISSGAGRRLLRYYPAKPDAATLDEPVLEQEFRPTYTGAALSRGWQLRTKLATSGWNGNLVLGHGPNSSGSVATTGYWSVRPGEFSTNNSLFFLWGSGIPNGGIGTEGYISGRPPFKVQSDGDCVTGNDMYVQDLIYAGSLIPSDVRLKDDISGLSSALDAVMALNPVSFTWKKDGKPDTGLIAQEVQQVLPALVKQKGDYLHVDYTKLIAYLVKAIQELKHGAATA
jgi:hypothetical protein